MPLPYYVSPEQMRQGEAQPQASRVKSKSASGGPA
jgi:hypothetical protein